jgi:hypothetical protein
LIRDRELESSGVFVGYVDVFSGSLTTIKGILSMRLEFNLC